MNDIGGLESPDTGPQGYGPDSGVVQPSLWEGSTQGATPQVRMTWVTMTDLYDQRDDILACYPFLRDYRVGPGEGEGSVEAEVREDHGTEAAYAWCELREIEWLLGED